MNQAMTFFLTHTSMIIEDLIMLVKVNKLKS